eukprot:6550439-Alexandrium_andersonii.AAC.1
MLETPRLQRRGGRGPSTPNGPNGPLRGLESAKAGDSQSSVPGARARSTAPRVPGSAWSGSSTSAGSQWQGGHAQP